MQHHLMLMLMLMHADDVESRHDELVRRASELTGGTEKATL